MKYKKFNPFKSCVVSINIDNHHPQELLVNYLWLNPFHLLIDQDDSSARAKRCWRMHQYFWHLVLQSFDGTLTVDQNCLINIIMERNEPHSFGKPNGKASEPIVMELVETNLNVILVFTMQLNICGSIMAVLHIVHQRNQ